MNSMIKSMNCKIRSVWLNDAANKLLVGTRGSEIVEVTNNFSQAKILNKGHFDLELWGLTVHSAKKEFYTVGEDKMLAAWDISSRK